MSSKKIEIETQKLFSSIHPKQFQSDKIFKRLKILLNHKFFGVKKNFFKDKICLDAGCGLNLNATLNLLELGAKYVYSCDLNPKLKKLENKQFKKYKEQYETKVGNLKKLPYKNNFFDFVHCAGAIHHTTNYIKAIQNLCRVTKKGGYIYIEAYGSGGLARELTSDMRKKIKTNKNLREQVKNLNKNKINNFLNYLTNYKHKKLISKLFDDDLVLTIKDRLLSPLYVEFSDKEIINILKKNDFYQIKRLKRKPHLENIRKYLIKLYYNYDHKYAKLLYGSGMPCIFAKKKND